MTREKNQEYESLNDILERSDEFVKEILIQYKNEISKLQKLRAKELIAHQSEKELLLAKIEELKKHPITVVIERESENK